MGDTSAIGQLIRNAHACAVVPLVGPQDVEVLVKAIHFGGFTERRIHPSTKTYVKIFVDDREVNLQGKVLTAQTLNPSWNFEPPIVLRPYPSSEIRVSLYRTHALRSDEHLCDIKGSAWKLLSENNEQHRIRWKASYVIGQIDMAIRDPAAPKSDRPANIEHVLHDFGVLYLQGKARAGPARSGGPLIQNDTLFDCIGDVLEALSSVSAVFPICKVAFVLLQAVQKALKEIRSVDEDIRSLFRALYETVRKAAACCGRNPIPGIAADLQRIGRVAGSSAETVDKWIHEKALKRVFHAGHVHDQLRHCMQELENVQDDIQFNVELALCQTAAWNLPLGANVAPTSPRPAHPFAQTESPRPRSSNRVEVAMRNETPAHRTLSGPRSYTRSDSGRSHTSRGHLTYPDSPPSAAFSSRRKAYATQDYGEHTFNPDQSSLTLPIVLPHTPESYSTPLPSEPEWENDHRTSTEEEFYYSGEDEDEEEHPLPHAINLPLNSYAHADDGYKAYTDSPIPRYRVTN